MNIVTWNVNGIRAREAQVLDWSAREQPDVVCLQEIKATPAQVPAPLVDLDGYWCYWHGGGGYSGVALLVSKALAPERPTFTHPEFDFEHRIVQAECGGVTVASIYVPNGGKDFQAKMRFLDALAAHAASLEAAGRTVLLCGDLNIARTEADVHPKERKPRAIGQLPEERALLDQLIGHGLADVARQLAPDDDALFTWWPPWRSMRQRNIGWRIDYILASQALASSAAACTSYREFGTSDHAPVMATFAPTPTT